MFEKGYNIMASYEQGYKAALNGKTSSPPKGLNPADARRYQQGWKAANNKR